MNDKSKCLNVQETFDSENINKARSQNNSPRDRRPVPARRDVRIAVQDDRPCIIVPTRWAVLEAIDMCEILKVSDPHYQYEHSNRLVLYNSLLANSRTWRSTQEQVSPPNGVVGRRNRETAFSRRIE